MKYFNVRSVIPILISVLSHIQSGDCQFNFNVFSFPPLSTTATSSICDENNINCQNLNQIEPTAEPMPMAQIFEPTNLEDGFADLFNWNADPLDKIHYAEPSVSQPFGAMQLPVPPVPASAGSNVSEFAIQAPPRVIDCDKINLGLNLSSVIALCPKSQQYFSMNPRHMTATRQLKQIFLDTVQSGGAGVFLCACAQARQNPEINSYLWMNSLLSAAFSRRDLSGIRLQPPVTSIPSRFFNSDVLREAIGLQPASPSSFASQLNRTPSSCAVLNGRNGQDNGIEHLLWYWREDIMVNSNHWFWHLINPNFREETDPPRPNRRGELFYFFHDFILARYNAERISNGLGKVIPIQMTHDTIIQEPYFPHLGINTVGQEWASRPRNTPLQDILNSSITGSPMDYTISDHVTITRRIQEAIRAKRLLRPDNMTGVSLNSRVGIDLLSEAIESSAMYSINPKYYGEFGLHNQGHVLIGFSQNPQGTLSGPIGDVATSMRDPVFYRHHSRVSELFHEHKDSLTPYHPTQGEYSLDWYGVAVKHVRVVSHVRNQNELITFWNYTTFNLSAGLDVAFNRSLQDSTKGSLCIDAMHLDHEPFQYEIELDINPSVTSTSATIRIFLAPKYDENGDEFTYNEQRSLFFPLDTFTQSIRPGRNFIRRRSIDSVFTIPGPQRLAELSRENSRLVNGIQTTLTPNCGCGWPHYLLLPKGTPQGMLFDLFVMATNGEDDFVPNFTNAPTLGCTTSSLLCGTPGQEYPDSRPMGYPFDRRPYSIKDYLYPERPVKTLKEYTWGISNMAFCQVRISHISGYKGTPEPRK